MSGLSDSFSGVEIMRSLLLTMMVVVALTATVGPAGATGAPPAGAVVSSLAVPGADPSTAPPPVIPAAGMWHALPPQHLWEDVELDGEGPTELSLDARGVAGIPATDVAAVAITVTITSTASAGSLTLWGSGTARPAVPSMTFTGAPVSSLVWVPVSSDGRVRVGTSSPGWVRFTLDSAGFASTTPTMAAGNWVPLDPQRVLDTASGQLGTGPLRPQRALMPQLSGLAGLPTTGVSAVSMVVTVRNPTRTGFLSVRPKGEIPRGTKPGGSSLNFNTGQTAVSALVVVPLGIDGRVQLFNNSYGQFDLTIDITGYLTAGQPNSGGLRVQKMTRLIDTRNATGPAPRRPAGPLEPGERYTTAVLGSADLPGDSLAAVLLSVTVNRPTATGSVSVSQTGRNVEGSNGTTVSFAAGQNSTNLVLVPVGSAGQVDFANNSTGKLHLLVDVVGYIAGAPTGDHLQWSDPVATIPSMANPALLDCPTVTFCMAVNADGEYSIFDGADWRAAGDVGLPVSTPDYSPGPVTELSCPTETFCAAANSEWIAVFRNNAWEPAVQPEQLFGVIMGLSCVGPDFCFTFSNHGNSWCWGGSAWSQRTRMVWDADGSDWPVWVDVSCAPPTFCVTGASNGAGLSSADPEAMFSWIRLGPTGSTGIDVSCLSVEFCASLNVPSATATFDGVSWTAWDQAWPTPMTSLSCGDPAFCVTVGSANRISVWDGTDWTSPADPVTVNGSPILVSCPTGDFCMSLDKQGRQLVGRR